MRVRSEERPSGGPGPLLLAIVVLVTAAALAILTVTAAPGDRGIPDERIEHADP